MRDGWFSQKSEVYSIEIDNRYEALEKEQQERTPEELWKEIKVTLLESAETTISYKMRQKQKPWIIDETLEMIREKREAKTWDKEKYKKLKR